MEEALEQKNFWAFLDELPRSFINDFTNFFVLHLYSQYLLASPTMSSPDWPKTFPAIAAVIQEYRDFLRRKYPEVVTPFRKKMA